MRFVARAERCADVLRDARRDPRPARGPTRWSSSMPDVAFNNAFVAARAARLRGGRGDPAARRRSTSRPSSACRPIPATSRATSSRTTCTCSRSRACGAGSNRAVRQRLLAAGRLRPVVLRGPRDALREPRCDPASGGRAGRSSPACSRPAYAGEHVNGGELSSLNRRLAPVGHHYLVGAMFVRFLDRALRRARAVARDRRPGALAHRPVVRRARSSSGFGVSFGTLLDRVRRVGARDVPGARAAGDAARSSPCSATMPATRAVATAPRRGSPTTSTCRRA